MKTTVGLTIRFGRNDSAGEHCVFGWAEHENGFTWMVGPESALILPRHTGPHGCFIELAAVPHLNARKLEQQRVLLTANGRRVGEAVLRGRGVFAWYVPPLPALDSQLLLQFRHPDAARPIDVGGIADRRELAVAAHRLRVLELEAPFQEKRPSRSVRELGLLESLDDEAAIRTAEAYLGFPVHDLVTKFESLGDNCELGLFQRRCDAEPLGLLRFSTAVMEPVIAGIDTDFEGLGDPAHLDPRLDANGRGEWIMYEHQYALRYHTQVWEHQARAGEVLEREQTKLKFLRRKFAADVEEGDKIFVCKRGTRPIPFDEILPLFLAIRRRSEATVLWIENADEVHPPGLVETVLPGLMRGYISAFAPPESVPQLSVPGWLSVCANAWLLYRRLSDTPAPADQESDMPALAEN